MIERDFFTPKNHMDPDEQSRQKNRRQKNRRFFLSSIFLSSIFLSGRWSLSASRNQVHSIYFHSSIANNTVIANPSSRLKAMSVVEILCRLLNSTRRGSFLD